MKSMNVCAIVQARMGSTRLHGKVLMDIEGKPLLGHVIERLGHCKKLNKIIIAVSINEEDNALETYLRKTNVDIFRGSENDVLGRLYECAKKFNVDIVLRITSDDPLIDPDNIDMMIESHIKNSADLTNTEGMPLGTGPGNCVISFAALEKAAKLAEIPEHREHADDFILENTNIFNINILHAPPELNRPDYRLTVDTSVDMEFMRKIYRKFYNHGRIVRLKDVVQALDSGELKQP